jgi:uncharacterized protein YkwD
MSTTSVQPTAPRRRRPALVAVALALFVLLAAGCMPDDARTFLDRTNALRKTEGVRALKEHDTLTRKAEDWAQHMARTGRLEHSKLTDGLGGLRWTALGENVGYSSRTSDTLKTIHNLFVNSAGHRANLVNPKFTHMGVGVATDSRGRVWVAEVFARL